VSLFTIIVETQFKAKHSIALPDGPREPAHEHFWAVSVEVSSDKLTGNGEVMSFAKLKSEIINITSKLNETSLDDIDYFRKSASTSENVAKYVFDLIEPKLPAWVRLEAVMVSEQVGCSAKYSKKSF
jgi:6-pyruvoyl-tetrahydropterin synthase